VLSHLCRSSVKCHFERLANRMENTEIFYELLNVVLSGL
jgi:hypothetical protein